MADRDSSSGSASDTTVIAVLVTLAFLAFMIEYFHGAALRSFLLAVYGVEIWIANLFTRFMGYDYAAVINYAFTAPGDRVYWSDVMAVGGVSNFWWRFVLPPAFLAIGIYVARKMPGSSYSGNLDFERFIAYSALYWKYVKPWVNFNPEKSKNPADLPALKPSQYAKTAERDGEIDESILRTKLARQLRTPWTKPQDLPDHMKMLFACFALKCADNKDWWPDHKKPNSREGIRDEVFDFENDINESFDPAVPKVGSEKVDAWVNKVFANEKIMARATAIAKRHAYAETALLSILEYARLRGGVFAPAQFRWLKSIDRTLWYPLCDARPPRDDMSPFSGNFHIEGAGIIAHWLAEKTFQAPISEPYVENALVNAIKWIRDNE